MLDLNEVAEVCEALDERLGLQEWTVKGPTLYGIYDVYDGDGNRFFTGVEQKARFIACSRTWLPALAAELRHVQAERDTLSALLPLYYAVDDYLHEPGTNDYPEGHNNPGRLEALRGVFLGVSLQTGEEESNA